MICAASITQRDLRTLMDDLENEKRGSAAWRLLVYYHQQRRAT